MLFRSQTTLFTKVVLFIGAGLITAIVVLANVIIAYRNRPVYAPMAVEVDNLERYRTQIEPKRRVFAIALFVLVFYMAGSSATPFWSQWLQFTNATDFGVKDPQFNLDISFFAFKLPIYQSLIGLFTTIFVLSLIASVVVHYLYGGVRIPTPGQRLDSVVTVAARVQISVLIGFIVLAKAAAYWFDRYGLALKQNRLITGLTYTDVNALLPAKVILAGIDLVS